MTIRPADAAGHPAASTGQPLVSVVMNCYNGAQYLRQAVESVLAQTYPNWEIVFWDNQSTDASAEIFRSYEDLRLVYHRADHHTALGEARNMALEHCRGELVAFLDVDDWWTRDKLEQQVPLFRSATVGMSCGNYVAVNERYGGVEPTTAHTSVPSGQVLDDLLRDFFVHFSTFVVRKDALERLAYVFDPRFNIIHDFDLVIRLSLDWRMASVQRPIAYYRWHHGNTGYRTNFLISDEFKTWLGDFTGHPVVMSQPHFATFVAKARLYEVLQSLYVGRRLDAWRHRRYVSFRRRLKLLVALCLPTSVVRRWIDQK